MKVAFLTAALSLALAACGAWPKDDAPARTKGSGAWPTLLPFDEIAGPATTGDPQSEAQGLSARAAALQARAQVMRRSVPDQDAFEALRARLAR